MSHACIINAIDCIYSCASRWSRSRTFRLQAACMARDANWKAVSTFEPRLRHASSYLTLSVNAYQLTPRRMGDAALEAVALLEKDTNGDVLLSW